VIALRAAWAVVHSLSLKAQIPTRSSRAGHRLRPCGSNRSTGQADLSLYSEEEAADIGAVLTPSDERAVLVTMSRGRQRTLLFAAEHPERVEGRC
jgi:pimeloyl-ACP methyl ester carboxylesterase